MSTQPSSSVLIVSYRRPDDLARCLGSLSGLETKPDEVIVVWQGDDVGTRDRAESLRDGLGCPLSLVHSPEPGVVAAENAGRDAAVGEILILIDDDATAPPDWVARHVSHYRDPKVGAVGGPAVNHDVETGEPFKPWPREPIGKLTTLGKFIGHMHDQDPAWRDREPIEVDHLVGYNMSLRKVAIDRFESGLRRYWQMFEADACLQASAKGYKVLFDFANVVNHYPTNSTYDGKRDGDLSVKVYNGAYNHAYLMAKHSPFGLRLPRLLNMLLVGSTSMPGLLGSLVCMKRYGNPLRELKILANTWKARFEGWSDGRKARGR